MLALQKYFLKSPLSSNPSHDVQIAPQCPNTLDGFLKKYPIATKMQKKDSKNLGIPGPKKKEPPSEKLGEPAPIWSNVIYIPWHEEKISMKART